MNKKTFNSEARHGLKAVASENDLGLTSPGLKSRGVLRPINKCNAYSDCPTSLFQSYEGHTSLYSIKVTIKSHVNPLKKWPAIRSFSEVWRHLVEIVRKHEIEFGFTLTNIRTVFSSFKIELE